MTLSTTHPWNTQHQQSDVRLYGPAHKSRGLLPRGIENVMGCMMGRALGILGGLIIGCLKKLPRPGKREVKVWEKKSRKIGG